MSLDRYRAKRRFDRTPEPSGTDDVPDAAPGSRSAPDRVAAGRTATAPRDIAPARFVVQRHRATALHYDVRLEIDGVLASWAVPRGPSMDPSHRRLAIRVEDHPLGYRDFEGVIPPGEYGAGDVIVWDRGHWLPDPPQTEPGRAIVDGELTFVVLGERLRGGFVFVRTPSMRGRDAREKWLLIHRRDDEAIVGWSIEAEPTSVLSGRTNEEVSAGAGRRRRERRHEEAALRRESAASR